MGAIDRRAGLSYAQFVAEYLLPRRPVILTDALEHCPARHRWTPDYFRERVGNKMVKTDSGWMRFTDFLTAVEHPDEDGKVPFLRERPLPWMLPELLRDVAPTPAYVQPNWLDYPFARWADPFRRGFGAAVARVAQMDINFAGAGIRFPFLHLDRYQCHALIQQWYGHKEFFVFGPEQTPNLYPDKCGSVSKIDDVEHPDLQKFPLFAQAKMLRFTLAPGEALFNPTGWWHTTRTHGVSIATVVSFGNRSNWFHMLRHMIPDGWLARAAFAPFAAYLAVLGVVRLPFYRFEDPANPAAAQRRQAHFKRIGGAWFSSAW